MFLKKMTLVLPLLLLLTVDVTHAQFRKFKSQGSGGSNNPGKADQLTSKEEENEQNKKIFGRGTGISAVNKNFKSKKYVNLNPETAFGPEVIRSFDFPKTDILELTKHMQKLTGINIILGKGVKGKISILAPSPITVGDAWRAFLTALNINGLSLVPSGSFYKIIQSKDVRYTPTKIYSGTYTPNTDNYVMRIIPLKNIDASQIDRSFRPFMSRYGRIINVKQTNTLIIHDTGSNINRLVKLIKFLDVPGHEESLQIIKVKHSSAQEIARLLDSILRGKGSSRFRSSQKTKKDNISKIIAEPRTNSIIAMANSQGAQKLRELVKKLDVKVRASGGGKIHVYYLNYSNAEALAKTLSSLVSGSGKKATRSGRFSSSNQSTQLFSDAVKVQADPDNNALVVTASPTDYLTLRDVIAKLDIPRDQVYVEGMIMETSANRTKAFGINILGAFGSGSTQKFGFQNQDGANGLVDLITNNVTNLTGLFAGIGIGRKVDIDLNGQTVTVNGVNGLIKAVAAHSSSNVLATPQILVLDNSTATFEVGETVPVRETTTANNGSTTNSIRDQKAALTLEITPHINKVSRLIRLKIKQNINDFVTTVTDNSGNGIATTVRTANTTVVVRDRDTIAMGGLMRDREQASVNKVPLLGDIPVLGWLFRQTTKTLTKVNLLIFITPRILGSSQKGAAKNLKDLLNRRSYHLKHHQAGDDPFASTVKGLYKKAKRQEQGALFDQDPESKIQNPKNTDEDLDIPLPDEDLGYNEQYPNYQQIAKEAQQSKTEGKSQPQTPAKTEVKSAKKTTAPKEVTQDQIVPDEIPDDMGSDISSASQTDLLPEPAAPPASDTTGSSPSNEAGN